MTLREAIETFKDHQKNSVREKTRESYGYLFRSLEASLSMGSPRRISISFSSFSPKGGPNRPHVSATLN
jgi:hypothetical protein